MQCCYVQATHHHAFVQQWCTTSLPNDFLSKFGYSAFSFSSCWHTSPYRMLIYYGNRNQVLRYQVHWLKRKIFDFLLYITKNYYFHIFLANASRTTGAFFPERYLSLTGMNTRYHCYLFVFLRGSVKAQPACAFGILKGLYWPMWWWCGDTPYTTALFMASR